MCCLQISCNSVWKSTEFMLFLSKQILVYNLFCGEFFIKMEINLTHLDQKQQKLWKVQIQFQIMGRHVNRSYIKDLVNQFYLNKKKIFNFCLKSNCVFCKRSIILQSELRKKKLIQNMQNMKDGSSFTINEKNLRLPFFQFLKDER